MIKITKIAAWFGIFYILTACYSPLAKVSEPIELTVAAAADLQFAFTEISSLFEKETGHKVTLVFGSSGQLAQQIENGAPYDLFAAANVNYINNLAEKGLVLPETIAQYSRGRLVLAVNRLSLVHADSLQDLLSSEVTRIAIANPDHAPYGFAAKEALQSIGVWEQIQPKLVYGENVRQALQYIQTGDAEVGIVALSIANVPEISWTLIDDSLYNPLDQALAVVTDSPNHDLARKFVAFVTGPQGQSIMQRYGFITPDDPNIQPEK